MPFYFESDVPKHKKKSKAKGQPRANHKHKYIEVALHTTWQGPYLRKHTTVSKAKVCEICGRVKENDWFGVKLQREGLTVEELIKNYPSWYLNDLMDKFAYKKEES